MVSADVQRIVAVTPGQLPEQNLCSADRGSGKRKVRVRDVVKNILRENIELTCRDEIDFAQGTEVTVKFRLSFLHACVAERPVQSSAGASDYSWEASSDTESRAKTSSTGVTRRFSGLMFSFIALMTLSSSSTSFGFGAS